MCNEKPTSDETRESQGCCTGPEKTTRAGCPCGTANCSAHRCLPILGVLAFAVAVPMVAKMVKRSPSRG